MSEADCPAAPVFDDAFRDRLDALFQWRRDVRHFRRDPVPEPVLDHMLSVTCSTPSVGLSQPWRFMRVDAQTRRLAVRNEFMQRNAEALAAQTVSDSTAYARLKLAGLDDAPHHIAVFCDPDPAQGRGLGRMTMPETVQWSAVMAIHSFWLAAQAHNVGLGWVSILDPSHMASLLDADPHWRFMAYLCVGYPEEENRIPELERRGWEQRAPARHHWLRR
ncbi:5,6-dimethylbenzimidazole synthase [Asaia krungthepensis]|uniref:Nitroreductase n=1 Tax=Asaia krungthepensis NRIC 0535 TaxID=1307925 RepID=A0ABQ0Q1B3_9PROT|nr:5,6-dimethylbenzimidazole synthase [Asaia krungthepensis]GBQ86728.1 nitroreductase [Asaia krungthepensis NRIC 0535]